MCNLGRRPKVPTSSFGDELQPAQMQRLNMSRELIHGRWNTWAKASVTAPILLPTGLMLRIGLCEVRLLLYIGMWSWACSLTKITRRTVHSPPHPLPPLFSLGHVLKT
jgi:hypothetical protein